MKAGDIVFSRSDSLASRFIRLMDGGDYSHTAFVVGDGVVVEATRKGVIRSNIYIDEDWRGVEWTVVTPVMDDEDRADAVAHAEWIASEVWRYDWISIFGMLLFWSTGGRAMISGGAKSAICSALVADCLHSGGHRFSEAIPHFYTPRMLQRHLGVNRA